MRKSLTLVMPLLFITCAAHAESEPDYLQEFPVVLSAARLNQPLSEAPNAMTVIDRAMITASGFRSLPDVFQLVPGMYVSYYKGSQPIVSYHGSFDQFARSMQVLIDGRSVYMPPSNMVDWAALPITLSDIERIEVIRGPAAASYGANSVHGVINIITRDAGAQQGRSVAITRGNKGINDVQGQFGAHSEKFDYRMTMAYTADNGFDDRTASYLPSRAQANLNNSNDSNQARLLNYRGTYYPNNRDSFDVQLGGNRDVQGTGEPTVMNAANPFHDLMISNSFQMLTWLHQTDNQNELKLNVSHTRNATRENFNLLAPPTIPAPLAFTQAIAADRLLLTAQHTLALSSSNRLVYGAEIAQEKIANYSTFASRQPLVLSNQITLPSTRVFAHDEHFFSAALLGNLGAMWEDDGMGHQQVSPRSSLNYHITPEHTLRMAASIAYRSPALTENYNAVASPYPFGDRFIASGTSLNLQSEKLLSREIGYLGQFNQHATSLDVRLFSDQFGQIIYYDNASSAFKNGVTGGFSGFETTLKHSLSHDTNLTLNWGREFVRSNTQALLNFGDRLSMSLPTNVISALWSQNFSNSFTYSISYYQQSTAVGTYSPAYDTQPFHRRVDVRLAQGFKALLGVDGEVAFVVQNLFKDNYTEYVAKNVFNQRSYVTVKLDF